MSGRIIIFLGDSHFLRLQRIVERFKDPKDEFINLSVSGSNVAKALDTLNHYIGQNLPQIKTLNQLPNKYTVFIFLGSNDCRPLRQHTEFNIYHLKKL